MEFQRKYHRLIRRIPVKSELERVGFIILHFSPTLWAQPTSFWTMWDWAEMWYYCCEVTYTDLTAPYLHRQLCLLATAATYYFTCFRKENEYARSHCFSQQLQSAHRKRRCGWDVMWVVLSWAKEGKVGSRRGELRLFLSALWFL